ncbi:hypothetical protein CIL05_03325 [Virgibacillus profundi]|uniref:DUF624 domain-containing protein n=1 Tax=Virgibacillus profundi TaxID=2024555 RepID=A0A2A2IGI7_9BACI|nr:DUF624 domain-containing protein [Virgibacillus profundi]PAV30767.1 hypothetical protein CIL05_03325 [Virgibacillus profundi]PXY54950.1 DUF624 domain-containing protein [Virgibacillus profundi]
MIIEGWAGIVYRITEKIMKIAYLNLLWFLFLFPGLVLLGLFPSTIALFTTVRKMILEPDVKIFPLFWSTYKSEFIKGNLIGYILLMIGIVIALDVRFMSYQTSPLFVVLFYVLAAFMLIYLILLINFFPVYVHYDLNMFKQLKQSLFIGILRPLASVIMAVSLLAIWVIMYFSPGLIVFFGASGSAYILMFIATRNFVALEQKVSKGT